MAQNQIKIAWIDFEEHIQYYKQELRKLKEIGCLVKEIFWNRTDVRNNDVLNKVRKVQPDLIIVHFDRHVPREAIKWIERFRTEVQGVKVVPISATFLTEYRADGFICVPSSSEEFLEVIIKVLGLSEEEYPEIWGEYKEWQSFYEENRKA